MTYIIGVAAGIVFGGIIGGLKSFVIWKKYGEEDSSEYGYQTNGNSIYARAMISYFVNILTLFAAFLVRNIVPFDGIAFLIATALTLAVMNHVWALRQKKTVKNN